MLISKKLGQFIRFKFQSWKSKLWKDKMKSWNENIKRKQEI